MEDSVLAKLKTVSIKEICEVTGLSKNTVYKLLKENKIPNVHVGSRYIVPKIRFAQWLMGKTAGEIMKDYLSEQPQSNDGGRIPNVSDY